MPGKAREARMPECKTDWWGMDGEDLVTRFPEGLCNLGLESAMSKRAAQLFSGLSKPEVHCSHVGVRRKAAQNECDCVLQGSQRPRIFPVFCPAIPRVWPSSS